MNLAGDDSGYRIARLTLIEGIRALSNLPTSSVILVGALAVYHHAPEAVGAMTPFTLDGDLVADPRRIKHPRKIYDALNTGGFSLRSSVGGLYKYDKAAQADAYAARLDVLVPAAFESQWSLDGYDKFASLATFTQEGLELCLVDHAPVTLGQIDSDNDSQSVEVEVAGVFALLVSKGHKIGERYAQGAEAFTDVRNDIADIYRLLFIVDFSEVAKKLAGLEHQPHMAKVARIGASHIRTLCGNGGAGSALLAQSLGAGEEALIIIESLEVLSAKFADVVDSALQS
jgi:hypothetical protein